MHTQGEIYYIRMPVATSITPKQRQFIANYTDPTRADTYLNQSRSAYQAYNTKSISNANSIGYHLLAKDHIIDAITALLDQHGASKSVRAQVLARIATGKRKTKSTTTFARDEQGNVTKTTTTTECSNRDVIAANKLISDLEDRESREHVRRTVTREMGGLLSTMRQAIVDSVQAPTPGPAREDTKDSTQARNVTPAGSVHENIHADADTHVPEAGSSEDG